MTELVKKVVRFSEDVTVNYVTDDSTCRYGLFWVNDAVRFKCRCNALPHIPVFFQNSSGYETIFKETIEANDLVKLQALKDSINIVSFYRFMFSAIISSHILKVLKENILKHKKLISTMVDNNHRECALQGLSNLIVSKGFLRPFLPHIFQLLYLEDIIDEDNIHSWYNKKYPSNQPCKLHMFGKCLITPLIEWLSTASEEDGDDGDGDKV